MRFILVFAWVIIISCTSNKRASEDVLPIPVDTLKRYSYNLMGFDASEGDVKTVVGTGFFIRQNKRLYLITARHVVTNCAEPGKPLPKKINVLLEDTSGLPTSLIPVDISSIKDTIPCGGYYPDAVAIPLDRDYNVYSVESHLYFPFPEISSVDIFGFPAIENLKYGGPYPVYAKASHLHIDGKDAAFFKSGDSLAKVEYPYEFLITGKSIKIDHTLKGYSGSPVFFKEKGSNKWRVGGVLTGVLVADSNKSALTVANINYPLYLISNSSQ